MTHIRHRLSVDISRPKVDRFVALEGSPYIIRYNSSLPTVVYVPEGMEVRYRVWRAEPKARSDETGLMDIVAWTTS
jgi:ecotin